MEKHHIRMEKRMKSEQDIPAPASTDYVKIIPTAWLTAYPKTFSDIALAQEIFHELEQIRVMHGKPAVSSNFKVPKLAPEIEARYKLVTKLLYQSGVRQVLEIAAGLSPRGMTLAKDPSWTYVEMDLPEMIAEKRAIAQRLISSSKIITMPNLHFEEGNALATNDLDRAVSHFEKKPIAVINEGLLRYLNFTQKAAVARNVHAILTLFGGVWITPDITLRKLLEIQDKTTMPGKNEAIIETTGINYNENRFENEQEAKKFFESFGFLVERHSFLEIRSELTSPRTLHLCDAETEEMIRPLVAFVMRVK